MSDQEIIEVVTAHKEGKKIQRTHLMWHDKEHYWVDDSLPSWDFNMNSYRVAPEPRKPREWNIKASVLDACCMIQKVIIEDEPIIRVIEVLND